MASIISDTTAIAFENLCRYKHCTDFILTYTLATCCKILMALSVFPFAINHLGVSGKE